MADSASSGIRAMNDIIRRTILRGKENYGPWKSKIRAPLNGEDAWQITVGREVCPSEVLVVLNGAGAVTNQATLDQNLADLLDFEKRRRKATSIITQPCSDSIATSFDDLNMDPVAIWTKLHNDFDPVPPALQALVEKQFTNFKLDESMSIENNRTIFDQIASDCFHEQVGLTPERKIRGLLAGIPIKYEGLKDAFYAHVPLQNIEWIWSRLQSKGLEQKTAESEVQDIIHGAALATESRIFQNADSSRQ